MGSRVPQHGFGPGRYVQRLSGDEFAISEGASVGRPHHAVLHAQLVCRDIEPRRRKFHQHDTHLRRRVLDGRAAVLHRLTARRVAFVRREAGVGRDELDPGWLDHEFLSRNLNECGLDALAELDLAGEHRDAAVCVDAYPRVEHRCIVQTARQRRRFCGRVAGLGALRPRQPWQDRKADHQRTGAGEKAAP